MQHTRSILHSYDQFRKQCIDITRSYQVCRTRHDVRPEVFQSGGWGFCVTYWTQGDAGHSLADIDRSQSLNLSLSTTIRYLFRYCWFVCCHVDDSLAAVRNYHGVLESWKPVLLCHLIPTLKHQIVWNGSI